MSETIEIRVPDIGDFTDVPVIEVLVAAGDSVGEEESLVTLESDKATMEVPSPAAGVIRELRVKLNDTVSEGDVVAVLETEAAGDAEPESVPEPKSEPLSESGPPVTEEKQPEAVPEPAPAESAASEQDSGPRQTPPVAVGGQTVSPGKVPYASPAIRAFARELGVNLSLVAGSGRNGRIVREDVAGFVKGALAAGPAPSVGAPAASAPFDLPDWPDIDFSKFGSVETRELSRIKKIAGANLHRNWVSIPHVTHNDLADITDMEAFRKDNAKDAIDQGFKLTPLVFLIKAAVAALRKFPMFNASLAPGGQSLIMKKYFNIGIAVDTPGGLVVPVIRECDRKGIMELARELSEVSGRAREDKLKPADWQGGCFSISSLGGIGGISFSPIINAPEVAILGVSRSSLRPVWNGEAFVPRLMLPLSLSYDHRVIDGASAARFTRYLAERLEDLRRLTL